MKNKTDPEVQAHIREQMRAGNYVEIAVPESRGADRWIPIGEQHANERSREKDLKAITPASVFVVSVLNPTSGLVGAVAVEPVQAGLLEVESTTLQDVPAHEVARRFAASLPDMRSIDERVSSALNSSSAGTYEELVKIAGSDDDLTASLKRIRHFQGSKVDIQTIESVVSIDPQRLLLRSVPSTKSEVVHVRYLGTEIARRREFVVSMQFSRTPDENTFAYSPNSERQLVRLDTDNNLRTLKILQASQLMDLSVRVRMEKHFDLRTTKWGFVISELVNESELLTQMDMVGKYVTENF